MERQFLIKDFFRENEDLNIDYYIEHRNILMHSHEFWELSYVYEGQGTSYFEDGRHIAIREGDFILISPGYSHCVTSPSVTQGSWVRVCNLLIAPEYMDNIVNRLLENHEMDDCTLRNMLQNTKHFCIQLHDEYENIYRLLLVAMHEHKHPSYGSKCLIENCILNLLISITCSYEQKAKNIPVAITKHDTLDEIIRYIRSNFGHHITLEFLAAYAHLSPEYLSRYFKKCTGTTISAFLTEIRIENAKLMLRTTNSSINEICIRCGYQSIGNFQKAFKKSVGLSAGDYRKSPKSSK